MRSYVVLAFLVVLLFFYFNIKESNFCSLSSTKVIKIELEQVEDNSFKDVHPRTAELLSSVVIVERLRDTIDRVERGEVEINDELLVRARTLIAVDNGHCKESALVLLSLGEISKDSFDSIVDHIIHYHDSMLVKMGMVELLRYKGWPYFSSIHKELAEVLIRGSIYARTAAAAMVHYYIDKDNYQQYKSVASQLDIGSKERVLLEAAIVQYQKAVDSS